MPGRQRKTEDPENSAVENATVKPKRYSEGEGFKAGQTAPKTVYVNRDRDKVGDSEFPEGGWVLVTEGDTVTEDIATQYEDLS